MASQLWRSLRQRKRWLGLRYQFWRDYFYSGEWELLELKKYVDRNKIALDIGGNIGVYAYHLHRLAREVITFEPNPEYTDVIADLRLSRCHVQKVALSSSAGSGTLMIPLLASGREDRGMASIEPNVVSADHLSRSFVVETKPLDAFNFTDVGFIKIDVEGHEESVLTGALDTIRANRPALLIEIEERHNLGGLFRIRDQLQTLNYEGFYFKNGRRESLSTFDLDVMQTKVPPPKKSKGHNRRQYNYVNNFLFLPASNAAIG